MTEFLIRAFVRNPQDTKSPSGREAYSILAAVVAMVANFLLCTGKFIVGLWSGSIAIQADAVNNLSDIGTNVVTLVGFKAASRPADTRHPFGHARLEYIYGLIISFIILYVGFELGRESICKIINPTPILFSPVTMAVLLASILVKFWMSCFMRKIGTRIQSTALAATTTDSLCDVISTGAILVSTVIGYFYQINLDGYIGVLVSVFVLYAGVGILKDTINPLLGEAPDPALVQQLQQMLLAYDGINGIHDIVIHSYGPGRTIATAHAEVASDADILEIHETIDKAEREVSHALNLMLTIHMDPISVNDPRYNELSSRLDGILQAMEPPLSFHDFRMVPGEKQTNLIFDIVVPFGLKHDEISRIKSAIKEQMAQIDPSYQCVITVDSDYTARAERFP